MNILTITAKNTSNRGKKYHVEIDQPALERIAGSLGLFKPDFIKDLHASARDMKARRFVKAKSLKSLR